MFLPEIIIAGKTQNILNSGDNNVGQALIFYTGMNDTNSFFVADWSPKSGAWLKKSTNKFILSNMKAISCLTFRKKSYKMHS